DEHALADLELVAVAQAYRLRNQLAPDERAVGTAEVGEPQATVAALELRVAARGALLAECEGRVRAAPDGADVLRDLEDRAFHRAAGAHDADRLGGDRRLRRGLGWRRGLSGARSSPALGLGRGYLQAGRGPGRARRRGGNVEQAAILHAYEQHGRGPLHPVGQEEDRTPRLDQRRVNRQTVDQRGVELPRERDGGIVADLELHPDHSRDAALDERRRHPRERIVLAGTRPFARVEHAEPHLRVAVEQRAKLETPDQVRHAVAVAEGQHA